MDDSVLAALERVKGFLDDVLARLCEYLYRYIVRYKSLLDEGAAEVVFRLGSRGEADLYLLKADINELFEEFELFAEAHGNDKRLIAVSQVNAAPDRSFVHIVFLSPFHRSFRCREKLLSVLVYVFHNNSSDNQDLP